MSGPDTRTTSENTRDDSEFMDRIHRLCYDGESVETVVDAGGDASIVVTSHRLWTFTPSGDGANFTQVDRPNVERLEFGSQSQPGFLRTALKLGLFGVLFLSAGFVLDPGAIIPDTSTVDAAAAEEVGMGGFQSLLETVKTGLGLLDEVLLIGGLVGIVGGIVFGALWYRRRYRTLVIRIAGADDVHVPRPETPAETRAQLERVLALGDHATDP